MLNICEHLKLNEKQATSPSSQFLDHCRKFNLNEIDQETLREQTIRLGFVNVIDAFQNVAQAEVPRFFDDARREKGGIVMSDDFYKLLQSEQQANLTSEVNSRWRLWETAISLDINPRLVEINADPRKDTLFVLSDTLRRVDVTSSREALNGYQKGRCFYCFRDIMIEHGHPNSCDVDHFFPNVLKGFGFSNLDQVWNLVFVLQGMQSRRQGGKFERIPDSASLNRASQAKQLLCGEPSSLEGNDHQPDRRNGGRTTQPSYSHSSTEQLMPFPAGKNGSHENCWEKRFERVRILRHGQQSYNPTERVVGCYQRCVFLSPLSTRSSSPNDTFPRTSSSLTRN